MSTLALAVTLRAVSATAGNLSWPRRFCVDKFFHASSLGYPFPIPDLRPWFSEDAFCGLRALALPLQRLPAHPSLCAIYFVICVLSPPKEPQKHGLGLAWVQVLREHWCLTKEGTDRYN